MNAFPNLGRLRVADAMHPGLISCAPDTPLRTVARMMATYRVHSILVTAHGEATLRDGRSWGVVTDADLLDAAKGTSVDDQPARAVAATPTLTVSADDDLSHAVTALVEREVSHLIVVEPTSDRPIGVLSTLDVIRALAGFPERHPAVPQTADRTREVHR
jgi:CBS domain-containing protein